MAPGQVIELPTSGRVTRRPQHPFYVYQRPFEITPFFIAPVLPGETLMNLLMQTRAVSDPLLNPLSGWWLEHYFFYVKLRDLDGRDDFTAMHLEPNYDLSTYKQASTADAWRYTAVGGVKWVDQCLTRVVDMYFRDTGEVASDHVISTGKPAVKINGNGWFDSLIPASQLTTVDVDVTDKFAVDTDGQVTDPLMASEVDESLRHYEFLRANGLVQMDYEDYLATFGIKTAAIEEHRPELVRYTRNWTYPTNTIDPSDGSPSSAVSWAIAERADKRRFFAEPGFLFGVSCARPKVFLRKQLGSLTGFMDNAFSWLPAVMTADPATSLRKFDDATGPVPSLSVDSVADMRDLFMYGEQFLNVDPTTAEMNGVALPAATADNAFFPSATDADALFVTVESGTAGVDKYRVRQDGIVSLGVRGAQRDTTPRGGNIRL